MYVCVCVYCGCGVVINGWWYGGACEKGWLRGFFYGEMPVVVRLASRRVVLIGIKRVVGNCDMSREMSYLILGFMEK